MRALFSSFTCGNVFKLCSLSANLIMTTRKSFAIAIKNLRKDSTCLSCPRYFSEPNFLYNKSVKIWGDGKVQRDYIYVNDVAEAFAKAMFYSGRTKIFNISSGYGTSINDLIEKIEDVTGYHINREYYPSRAFDVPVSILNNQLAMNCLGWIPTVGLNEGITRTANWIRNTLIS